jgi:hypothetical protein
MGFISYRPEEQGGILLDWNPDLIEASNLSLKIFSLTVSIRLKSNGTNFFAKCGLWAF